MASLVWEINHTPKLVGASTIYLTHGFQVIQSVSFLDHRKGEEWQAEQAISFWEVIWQLQTSLLLRFCWKRPCHVAHPASGEGGKWLCDEWPCAQIICITTALGGMKGWHSLIFCYTDEIKMMAFCHPDCTRKFLRGKTTSRSITTGQNEWSHSLEEQRYNWSKIKPFLLNQQTSKCQTVSSYALPA